MRTYDLTPLFRSTVGFDRWNDLFNSALRSEESAVSYPPYNIEKVSENRYRITMAVAGFGEDDLEVTARENIVVVTGKHAAKDAGDAKYLYRGIAGRGFERKFSLADHVTVSGAALVDGMLAVDLERELPEAMKPRKIRIERVSTAKVIEGTKAA